MFLARIDGTLTSTVKHETLEGCRFLLGQRLDAGGADVGEPLVLVDTLGAAHGATVLVTTDNEEFRNRAGQTTPVRMIVFGIVDRPEASVSTSQVPEAREAAAAGDASRLAKPARRAIRRTQ